MELSRLSLQVASLRAAYARSEVTASAVAQEVVRRIETSTAKNVWISRATQDALAAQVEVLEGRRARGEALPLYGIPCAVKDNIDAAGFATTAACPSYAYEPERDATVVGKLREAGALIVGKTNLDQFATGLVGTRSPYGACSSAFDERYTSGGSSSGSAVAVATGVVSFALGTDTAGSGRVPAGFNNLVGVKPSRGLLSTRGVVPACRSLDCVSVFALTMQDARDVMRVAEGFDGEDPYSRTFPSSAPRGVAGLRIGVPEASSLEFCGNQESALLYQSAVEGVGKLGVSLVNVDWAPFREATLLLYSGPWVAERYAAVGEFLEGSPAGVDPTVRKIILGGRDIGAADAFRGMHRLAELRRRSEAVWQEVDALLLPTTPTAYTHEEVAADPVGTNSNLGTYTNFVNLLDLAGVAVPAGFRSDGRPHGVSFFAPAGTDAMLMDLGEAFHRLSDDNVGAVLERVCSE